MYQPDRLNLRFVKDEHTYGQKWPEMVIYGYLRVTFFLWTIFLMSCPSVFPSEPSRAKFAIKRFDFLVYSWSEQGNLLRGIVNYEHSS